jgi:prepilin-type N-terminal cleavage/methylation domain-containing protein
MSIVRRIESQEGMTLIEVLVAAGIVSLMVVLGGMMVSRFTVSRSINDITRNISATLQMAKLKSARDGVEYRAVFSRCTDIDDTRPNCRVCNTYVDFAPGDESLTITLERGNSNKGSDRWCVVSSQTKKMTQNFNLDLTDMAETGPYRCGFGPKGFMVDKKGEPVTTDPAPDDDQTMVSMMVTPTSTSRVKTCGIVELSPLLGRINVVRGNWDGTACNPIGEP